MSESEFAQPVNTSVALETACADLTQSFAESKGEITYGDLPMVAGNQGQLVQLFQNLLANAIKYCSSDKTPRIRVEAQRAGEDHWLFSVADNGVGIAPEYLNVIFGAFKRLHGSEVQGSGIGLATCRRIIERHGGRIWAESKGPGHGSTFFFTLQAI
jgi:signal transduction histidine kinase